MSEKFQGEQPDKQPEVVDRKEYGDLLHKSWKGVDTLEPDERERLRQFGYHYLDVEKNGYEAMNVFESLQDFEGLRKTADLMFEYPQSHDLPNVLTMLEDYEGIRKLLNRGVDTGYLEYTNTFSPLDRPLFAHLERYLQENQTPVATGVINKGVDLVAVRNLARQYDIAVPIARGGLKQGAIANLWGMPTRIVDIAAHKRKVPTGEWVNPVAPEDFTGKNVLLFDKDAVTGASIRKAMEMLKPFQPASVGVYFAHNVVPEGKVGIGTVVEGLPAGLKIFYPKNAPLGKAGDAYIEAHERLGTLYGRRRLAERQFAGEAEKLKEKFPDFAKSMKAFASRMFRTFDSLNPFLPGIEGVREMILKKMQGIYKDHADYLKNKVYDLPGTMERVGKTMDTTNALPIGFEDDLIRTRYTERAETIAKLYEVDNPHNPSNPLAAFIAARTAVKAGFQVALIVGPEGFSYEPYFRDLGIWTLAVNIPESGEGEARTIKIFDDLSLLKGRKVLVVEDDVRTGATLQKLLEEIKPDEPARLGLYLGQPETFQKTTSIPTDFKDTYIAGETNPKVASREFAEFLESKGLKIFKTPKASTKKSV